MSVVHHGWGKCEFLILIKELVTLGAVCTRIWQRVLPQKDNFRPAVVLLTRKVGGDSGNRPPTAVTVSEICALLATIVVVSYAHTLEVIMGTDITVTNARREILVRVVYPYPMEIIR